MSVSFSSEALRTIGRDLDRRGIRTFLVRCEANLLVVEGGYQPPPAVTPLTLHYGLRDIERLDRSAQERNDHISPARDFLSLSEIFWTIAIYVISKQARLLSVSNTASTLTVPVLKIEYETALGNQVVEDLRGSAIYELCISVYKLRRTPSIDSSRYARFSGLA